MKKLLVFFVILTIFLSSCNFYNLSLFTLPDDAEFLACIQELDTPEKIGNYMNKNFTYKSNNLTTPDPYDLWKIQIGDCNDMATFAIFIANYHEYEVYQIKIWRYFFKEHMLSVYVELNAFSFMSNMFYYPPEYDSFREIVEYFFDYYYENWYKYVVYDYYNNVIEKGINN